MEKLFVFLCLGLSAVFAQPENALPELAIKFNNPETREVFLGEELKFTCTVNRGIQVVFQNKLVFEIRRPNDLGTRDMFTFLMGGKDAEPSMYDMERVPNAPGGDESYTMTIKSVRDIDEGLVVCRYEKNKDEFEPVETSVRIVIKRKIESLSMAFNGKQVNPMKTETRKVDVAEYPVVCEASGSNPKVENLQLYLNNVPIEGVAITDTLMEGEAVRHKTTLKASVPITLADSNHELSCIATQPFTVEGEMEMKASVMVQVNRYDPKIECIDAKGYTDMRLVKLRCIVDTTGLNIKDIHFKVKKQQGNEVVTEIVRENMNTKDNEYMTKEVNGNEVVYILNIHGPKPMHFDDAEFFLVVQNEKEGYETQVAVTLSEEPDPNDGSVFVTASLMTVLLCALLSAVLRL